MQAALLFTSAQINLIIIIAVVIAVLFAVNSVLLALFFYKRKKSKLCTEELQQRREQLLEELAQVRFLADKPKPQREEPEKGDSENDVPAEDETAIDAFESEDDAEPDDVDEGEAGDEIDSDGATEEVAPAENGRFRLKVLAVSDMTPLMRENFGCVGSEYDGKRYYVRYNYGFEAKLRASSDEIKRRYTEFVEETGRYKKLSVARGFRQQRLYCGRKTVGLILFRGKTLCVALALDPKKYEATKYRGIDKSGVKRFEKTPMLLKITSDRRLLCAKYLLNRLAEDHLIGLLPEPVKPDISVDALDFCGYYAEGLLKITVIGEAANGVDTE